MQSYFVKRSEGFQTHYLEWKPETPSNKLPVICIHGTFSNARTYKWIGEELSSGRNGSPRHVVAIDTRGCGESGMPKNGFTLEHMSTDIDAVMKHLGINKAHFIAHSRGVSYVLKYASLHPNSVHGFVVGDFQAHHPKVKDEWAKKLTDSYETYESWDHLYTILTAAKELSREEFEVRKDDFYIEKDGVIYKRFAKELPMCLLHGLEDYDLSPALDNIEGQLLILKGAENGSLLNDDHLREYQKHNPKIIIVDQAGHDVLEPREQVKDALIKYFDQGL
ncbi:hypothetical protein BC351_33710 [Paenibacillus ferrarius]|uniref:AB hydrolase-1 domain-containing protein n=1 Tax=Paenibacillus ferrarius TaxID=1469647 RepID=A0A1V4HDK0_9BACL|nr:alpha/beta hydrolase [Paenibacillus ferrarius]OPH51944.1 hypothetical protein BC351_33710 [Paenibacillus ferrarius]